MAVALAAAGRAIQGTSPPIVCTGNLLIYAAANERGVLCGFVNMAQQPVGSIRLQPGFSWHDLADDRRTQLEEDQLRPDAYVLALAISLCFVCHNRIV